MYSIDIAVLTTNPTRPHIDFLPTFARAGTPLLEL